MSLIIFLFCFGHLSAQVFPVEGDSLNYRIVGFRAASLEKAVNCRIEVAMGWYNREDSFKKHIVATTKGAAGKIMVTLPQFGQYYTWRMVNAAEKLAGPRLYHFRTKSAVLVDSSRYRLRVIDSAIKFKDCFVFSDATHTLYDMKGKPVWYLPAFRENQVVRDLRLTPQGTITLLINEEAYEVNYAGEVIWRGPQKGRVSGDSSEHFHHELVKLPNGHHMVLGDEHIYWKDKPKFLADSTRVKDPVKRARQDSLAEHAKTQFGTIIEYDEKDSIVWSWKSSDYFMSSDLRYFTPPIRMHAIDVHENSFYFDRKNSVVYLSFKNISRILKIRYPSGEVLASYGEVFRQGVTEAGNGLYCDQHACKSTEDGFIYLFNNNSCNERSELPEVLLLKEPVDPANGLKKVWEYECSLSGLDTTFEMQMKNRRAKMFEREQKMRAEKNMALLPEGVTNTHATSGGNVIEMPDHSFFVCMSSQFGKIFIVSREKKILWSAVNERFKEPDAKWMLLPQQYRASIITRKELEQMVWSASGAH